jgi:hypothetical protein
MSYPSRFWFWTSIKPGLTHYIPLHEALGLPWHAQVAPVAGNLGAVGEVEAEVVHGVERVEGAAGKVGAGNLKEHTVKM